MPQEALLLDLPTPRRGRRAYAMGREYSPTPPCCRPLLAQRQGASIRPAAHAVCLARRSPSEDRCAPSPSLSAPRSPATCLRRVASFSCSPKERTDARKSLEAAGQDAPHLGNGQTVVDDGYARPLAGTYATGHLGLIEHAGTAVDHEVEAGGVMGKLGARNKIVKT